MSLKIPDLDASSLQRKPDKGADEFRSDSPRVCTIKIRRMTRGSSGSTNKLASSTKRLAVGVCHKHQ